MNEIPHPPENWLREHTGPGSKASAGYGWQAGWQAGYAAAVDRLRDDDRYRNWWTADGAWQHKPTGRYWDAPSRSHLAEYLETVGPSGPRETHIIELRADGWTIQHPLACRPNLFDCPVNRVAERDLTDAPAMLGRFECQINDLGDRLLIGDPAGDRP